MDAITSRGPISEDVARKYWRQIIDAVKYLHDQDIVHRDIKLQNVILSDGDSPQLIDFGFALELVSDDITTKSDIISLTSKSDIKGTVGYVSPEMLEAQTKINKFYEACGYNESTDDEVKAPGIQVNLKKADIFSLGVILFEMVVGISPFLNARAQDPNYRYFYFKKRVSIFWDKHPKAKDLISQGKISEEFISLIEQILTPFPKNRPTIDEILEHPWMQL